MKNLPIEEQFFFLKEEPYTGNHDFFYNSTDFPAILELEAKWEIIRDEVIGLLADEKMAQVKNINPPYLSSPDAWKNFYFYNFGWKKHENCDRYPNTFKILKAIPNLIFAGITVLEPKSKVLPHNGETNTTIRCHLGLKIPAPYPICGVRVGTEEHGWEEGKVLMFSDAHFHNVWNDSDERRLVLVFDIVREEYANQSHLICAKALGALTLKFFYSKKPDFKNLPMSMLRLIHFFFSAFWYAYLPFQNRFRLP